MYWTECLPVIDNRGLFLNNFSIVEMWERPIQEEMARIVCTEPDSDILEIGYGLGLCAKSVNYYQPKCHLIIEAHPFLAAKAKIELPDSCQIICDYWENAVNDLLPNSFDSIIFDSYPFSEEPYDGTPYSTFKYIEPFLTIASRILREDGRLVFLDFSNSVHTIEEFEISYKSFFSSYDIISVELSIPNDCTYATGSTGNIVLLIK